MFFATLSLSALVSGLDGAGSEKRQAQNFIKIEVQHMIDAEREAKTAPKVWYACMAEINGSKVLEREVLRLYREEENARIMRPEELVRTAVEGFCEDALY